MLRTAADQPTFWQAILPEESRRLPVELARVDALLDDPVFFTPFVPFFDLRIGRPSTPMDTYLRMMFLKFRYRLGFEPARSRRAGSANRSSSATRVRSATTTTASSSTTTSNPATPPTHPDSPRDRTRHRPHRTQTGHPGRGPRLRRSRHRRLPPRPGHHPRRHPPHGPTQPSTTSRRTTTHVPTPREMANRLRRPHQPPQTQLRMRPLHDRHHRRRPNLLRTRSTRPQPHQDRRPHRLTRPPGGPDHPR